MMSCIVYAKWICCFPNNNESGWFIHSLHAEYLCRVFANSEHLWEDEYCMDQSAVWCPVHRLVMYLLYYLRQGARVVAVVLSVCLSVSNTAQKLLNRFA